MSTLAFERTNETSSSLNYDKNPEVIEIWNPARYDTLNGICVEDAKELIQKMLKQESLRNVDVIFEIGCGTGRIACMLSKIIGPKKIVACDISKEMIDFALKEYNQEKNVQYLVQDFGVTWDELDERIRVLEATVDLVFSNYAMHLIRGKKNAVNNLGRLLKKGGHFCANIPAILFFKDSESEEQLKHREKYANWSTKDQQFNLFTDLFLGVGMEILQSETKVSKWTLASMEEFYNLFNPVSKALSNSIISLDTPPKEKASILLKYQQLYLNFVKENRGSDEIANDNSVTFYIDFFRFICCKE